MSKAYKYGVCLWTSEIQPSSVPARELSCGQFLTSWVLGWYFACELGFLFKEKVIILSLTFFLVRICKDFGLYK